MPLNHEKNADVGVGTSWILKSGTKYLFRITSLDVSATMWSAGKYSEQ